jgi:hypothetical protein
VEEYMYTHIPTVIKNEEKKDNSYENDFWLCTNCGAQLPDCRCIGGGKYGIGGDV